MKICLKSRAFPWASLPTQALEAFLISALLFASDYAFFALKYGDRFPRPWSGLYETFGVLLLLTLGLSRGTYLGVLIGIHLLALLQMMNVSFFGVLVTPIMIWLFFTQQYEIWDTLVTVGPLFWVPFLLIGGSLLGTLTIWKKVRPRQPFKIPFMNFLLLAALLFGPLRAYFTGNDYGRQPSVYGMAFANLWSTSGYFLGVTLPEKIMTSRSAKSFRQSPPPIITPTPDVNVIVVMGESLGWRSMSMYGYERGTTPLLEKLVRKKTLIARKAVSGGVSTDVSLPLFLNVTNSQGAAATITSQSRCLFKLAKDNGFETHFYTIQNVKSMRHILNYICPDSIDHTQIGVDPMNLSEDDLYLDEELIPLFEKIDFSRPQFVVMQQRGSHAPYEHRFPKRFEKFQPAENDSFETVLIKNYDNSVYYTDYVLADLIRRLRTISNRKTYFIFTSDHSEAMGEEQTWGHNILSPYVTEVPFLFYSNDERAMKEIRSWPKTVTHFDLSNLILRLIGYQAEQPPSHHGGRKYTVLGPDLGGLGGSMEALIPEAPGPIQFSLRSSQDF
jgi:glucan phosphoethanolaminetransferase (alkaline phosphatase superfamily)